MHGTNLLQKYLEQMGHESAYTPKAGEKSWSERINRINLLQKIERLFGAN